MNVATTVAPTIRLLSWNMGAGGPGPTASWSDVIAEPEIDVALLQEAPNPYGLADIGTLRTVPAVGARWGIGSNRAQTAIAVLSDRVEVTPFPTQPLGFDGPLELGVSRPGTVTVAKLQVRDSGEELLAASVYAQWEGPASGGPGIYADASMHRVLSDLSPLFSWRELPIIVAGDFNVILDADVGSYGGNWRARDRSVFDRLNALGLRLAGPRAPHGIQADPHPSELPEDSLNVPTYRTAQGNAVRQLDYCYVSPELVDRVTVRALNSPEEWGPSDHCRIRIDLAPPELRTWTKESFLTEIRVAHGTPIEVVVNELFDWAHTQGLRVEFGTGPEGQWYGQLDDMPGGTQFTFSVRTRGDVVIQFQWMKPPYDTIDAREVLRQQINEAIGLPFAEIGADRLAGRPTIALEHLVDQQRRRAFLDVFSAMIAKTRDEAAR